MPVSRRNFLRGVGATGGAGAMFGAMGALGLAPLASAAENAAFTPPRASDFTLTGRSARSVLVLGAGIAGLTTAYELGKAGYRVTLLEGRHRPGGRNWTVRGGDTETDLNGETQRVRFAEGQYMNAGPARIPQHHVTLDYCRELGVAIEPFVNQNADALLYYTGDTAISNTPVKHRAAKADVYGYVSELLSKATNAGALDGELSASDKEALIEFLRDFGDLGNSTGDPAAADLYLGGSGRRGFDVEPGAGLEAGSVTPAPGLHDVLASGIGREFTFEFGWDQAMMMFQPVGGMDRIAYALERAVGPGRIRYGAEVTGIRTTPAGGEVDYVDARGVPRTASADFVVNTIPPHIAARIPHNLGPGVTTALQAAKPAPTGKIGLEYSRRWWEDDMRIYGGITNTDLDLAHVWYPSSGFHTERGVVVGYYNYGQAALEYQALPHAQRRARAVRNGALIHGDVYGKDIASSFSVSWAATKYSEGGWVGWEDQAGPDYATLLAPQGNVYFAGDHLSHAIAWQHGAMTSARAAVTALHQRVMSS
ncbi:flavin monoamine oxidase family protein [Paenibacillus sp. TRM 82003]|uniref:flavin monoamine oxidase family protein n=1 Tax=Kineococcus sp. TRM81007 TaxID=2925831 RepID=UPI001F5A7ACC|nr:flavin monoamine oxidase family protein [Kineococcus sp. TRM81007]MCI2238757.1 flavin monoamine oxidase family protein [Kineococcus sp. TRM81007]MCI3924164.1 flavin monoamine oxidase family protein [Paenibacillus sp. TRM 82003]